MEEKNIEDRRREITRRINIGSLIVVAIAGALAVYMLGGQLASPERLTVIGLVVAYLGFRLWRTWRK